MAGLTVLNDTVDAALRNKNAERTKVAMEMSVGQYMSIKFQVLSGAHESGKLFIYRVAIYDVIYFPRSICDRSGIPTSNYNYSIS